MFNKECRARYELKSWKVKDSSSEIFNFWDQLDDKDIKELYQLILPPIKLNHLIYIPMIA
jgi:DNA-binding protein Fis